MNEYRFEDLYIGKEEYFSVTVTEEMMKMFLESRVFTLRNLMTYGRVKSTFRLLRQN